MAGNGLASSSCALPRALSLPPGAGGDALQLCEEPRPEPIALYAGHLVSHSRLTIEGSTSSRM